MKKPRVMKLLGTAVVLAATVVSLRTPARAESAQKFYRDGTRALRSLYASNSTTFSHRG